MWVFVHVRHGQQILSFRVSKATVYSTPTHSANTPPNAPPWSLTPLGTFISTLFPLILSSVHQVCLYYRVHLYRTPPSHSFWLPDIKQDWCGKYCGSDSLATDSTTHTHIHTPSFCKLDRMHMLFHWSTKLLQIRTYSLMAKGWRWWDHQRDQKPTDHSPVQEHDTHTHTCYICLFCPLHPVFSHHINWLFYFNWVKNDNVQHSFFSLELTVNWLASCYPPKPSGDAGHFQFNSPNCATHQGGDLTFQPLTFPFPELTSAVTCFPSFLTNVPSCLYTPCSVISKPYLTSCSHYPNHASDWDPDFRVPAAEAPNPFILAS